MRSGRMDGAGERVVYMMPTRMQRQKPHGSNHVIRKTLEGSFSSSSSGSYSSSYESGSSYDSETTEPLSSKPLYTAYTSDKSYRVIQPSKKVYDFAAIKDKDLSNQLRYNTIVKRISTDARQKKGYDVAKGMSTMSSSSYDVSSSDGTQTQDEIRVEPPHVIKQNSFEFPKEKNVPLKIFSQTDKENSASKLRKESVSSVVKGASATGPYTQRGSEILSTSSQNKVQSSHLIKNTLLDSLTGKHSSDHKAKEKAVLKSKKDSTEHSLSSDFTTSSSEGKINEPIRPTNQTIVHSTKTINNTASDSPIYGNNNLQSQQNSHHDKERLSSNQKVNPSETLVSSESSARSYQGKPLKQRHPPLETKSSLAVRHADSDLPLRKSEELKLERPSETETGFEIIPTNPNDDGHLYSGIPSSRSVGISLDAKTSVEQFDEIKNRYTHVSRQFNDPPDRDDSSYKRPDLKDLEKYLQTGRQSASEAEKENLSPKNLSKPGSQPRKDSAAAKRPNTYDGILERMKKNFEDHQTTYEVLRKHMNRDGQYNLREFNEAFVDIEKGHKKLLLLIRSQIAQKKLKSKSTKKPAARRTSLRSKEPESKPKKMSIQKSRK